MDSDSSTCPERQIDLPSDMDEGSEIKASLQAFHDVSLTSTTDTVQAMHKREPKRVGQICDRLLKEEDDWPCLMARIRIYNLVTFLLFLLDMFEEAVKYNEKAIALDSANITALTNKAWILFKQKTQLSQIKLICDRIECLIRDRKRVIVAKAEVVHAYSRFGSHFQIKVLKMYQAIIGECVTINEPDAQWKTNENLWKFGLALVNTRILNANSMINDIEVVSTKMKRQDIARQLISIIRTSSLSTESIANLCRGRTLVILAKLVQNTPGGYKDLCSETVSVRENYLLYVDEALRLCPDDPFVLEQSGPLFKRKGFLYKSIETLTAAIDRKETSFACEHLALSLIAESLGQGPRSPSLSANPSLTRDQVNLIRSIQFPTYTLVQKTDDSQVIEKIENYLDRAFQLGSNYHALHEKIRLYRQLGRHNDVLDAVRPVLQSKAVCSMMLMSKSYEEAVYCLIHMMPASSNVKHASDHKQDIKRYMKMSIELSCKVVANFSYSKQSLVPRLQRLLAGTKIQRSSLQAQSHLEKLVGNFKGAVEILVDLKNFKDPKDLIKLTEMYMKDRKFDDAILGLNLLKSIQEGDWNSYLDGRLVVSGLLDGGFEALMTGDQDVAGLRIKDALTGLKTPKPYRDIVDDNVDVFLVCERGEEIEKRWRHLVEILQDIGLIVSLNLDNALGNDRDMSYISSMIETTPNVLICLSSNCITGWFEECIQKIHDGRNTVVEHQGVAVIRDNTDTTILQRSPMLASLPPCITVDLEKMCDQNWSNDYVRETVKIMLLQLALPK